MIHGMLDIFRQGTGHSSHIHLTGITAFRFNKYLMPVFICKPHYLVLNRRTIPGSGPFDLTRIQRRTVQIGPDNLMGFFIGISQPAGFLLNLHRIRICRKRKRNHPLISQLFFHLAVINRSSVDPGRRPGLKAVHLNSKFFQRICQVVGRLQSIGSCMTADFTIDTSGIQISSGTENDGFGIIHSFGIQANTIHFFVFCKNFGHFCLHDLEMLGLFQHHTHGTAVLCFVRLCPK